MAETNLKMELFGIGFLQSDNLKKGSYIRQGVVIDFTKKLSDVELEIVIDAATSAGAYQRGEQLKKLCNL
jgi:hypothetical protein